MLADRIEVVKLLAFAKIVTRLECCSKACWSRRGELVHFGRIAQLRREVARPPLACGTRECARPLDNKSVSTQGLQPMFETLEPSLGSAMRLKREEPVWLDCSSTATWATPKGSPEIQISNRLALEQTEVVVVHVA